MRIGRVESVDDELVDALSALMPQLSRRAGRPTREHLEALVADERTALLVARDGEGRIVGTLTLATYRTPRAHQGWIEAVVVDEAVRGQGIGEALTREALRLAAAFGLDRVRLTSRVERAAANRLYPRVGFELHETNVYAWPPDGAGEASSPR